MDAFSAFTLTIIVTNLILGFSVLIAGEKDQLSKTFFFLSILVAFWLTANFLTDYFSSPSVLLFWARITNVFATWAVFSFLYLASTFPVNAYSIKFRNLIRIGAFIPTIFTFLIFTPWFLSLSPNLDQAQPNIGPLVLLHLVYLVLTIGASLYLLFSKRKKISGIEKSQVTYILYGLGLTTFFGLLFSAIIPLFIGIPDTVKLAPLSTIFFLGFSAYAITRHGLFSIKVIATEVTVLALVIINFIQLLTAKSLQDLLLRALLLGIVGVMAYLLVKSVQNEVTRRHEVEELAKEKTKALAELEQRNKNLATLQKISRLVLDEIELKPMAQKILDEIPRELENCRGALLNLVKGGQLGAYAISSTDITEKIYRMVGADISKYSYPLKSGFNLLHDAILTKQAKESARLSDFISPPIPKALALTLQKVIGARHAAAVPLTAGSEPLGVMLFVFKVPKDELSPQDMDMIRAIADDMSIAIQRAEAYQKLKDANEYLAELDKLKDEFISMASHELNTPLAAVEGYLSMILEEGMGKVDPKAKEYLRRAYDSSKRLAELIMDLLNVSRIEQGRLKMKFVKSNLYDLAESVVHELQIKADANKLSLKLEADRAKVPETWCDADRIREVFVNLVGNSIKYTQKGGITIRIHGDDHKVTAEVSDTGRGIAKVDQKKLFQKFSQVKREQDQQHGTGLGLYISKNFIELHKGRIWVESEEGKGSTFAFEIPVLKAAPKEVEGAVLENNQIPIRQLADQIPNKSQSQNSKVPTGQDVPSGIKKLTEVTQ